MENGLKQKHQAGLAVQLSSQALSVMYEAVGSPSVSQTQNHKYLGTSVGVSNMVENCFWN